jgi:prolyl-tRNA editing enzyme YbaK/EbsC (Cys-tRNA(Pro) deacylase)
LSDPGHIIYPKKVQVTLKALEQARIVYQVKAFDAPGRTAVEAASLLECALSAIVKSLVFKTVSNDELFMVLMAGHNRADLDKLSGIIGEDVRPASAQEILNQTGYHIGAVTPFALGMDAKVIMDADLLLNDVVWASAGAEHIFIGIDPNLLHKLNNSTVLGLKANRRK